MKNNVLSWLEAACGVAGSVFAGAFGGWDAALQVLLIFMLIDYVTGLIVAGVFHSSPKSETGSLESHACLKGLIRKGMILVIVLIAAKLDIVMGASYIRDAVCIAFIVNETISIIENAGLMGVPVPSVIKNAIDILKKKSEGEVNKNV